SEDWNQPRCWSLPSRYTSACHFSVGPRCCAASEVSDEQQLVPTGCCSSARRINTAREDEPESIHTSSVSLDLAAAGGPFQSFGLTRDQSSAADFSNQMFEPCFSN